MTSSDLPAEDADPAASRSRRRWLLTGGIAAAALGLGAGTALWRHRAAAPAAGEMLDPAFWSMRYERPEGGELELATLRGQPLLVNFWATWCPPCIEELPLIDAFFRRQSTAGWRVVGLAIDRPDAVRRFLAATPVSFPIGVAGLAGTDLVRRLGNSAGGLPFTLVVTGGGRVSARKMGKLGQADLDAWRAQVHS